MEVGIREAKNSLSALVASARLGEKVYLTNRGARVAEIIPASTRGSWRRAYGNLKGKVNLYPGWDSPVEDSKIEEMFEALAENKSK